MTDTEMLKAIMNSIETVQNEMQSMKNEMQSMKKDFNEKFEKLENKVDTISLKSDMTHKKLNDLSLDVQLSERNVRRDIKGLQDTVETVTVILEGKGILPKAM